LPIFSPNSNPYAKAIILAGTLALLLALARRLLPARWVPATAAVATVFVSVQPDFQLFRLAASLLFVGLLTFVYQRWGLAALLTASVTSSLLPGMAFSALRLSWLPWTFAATAGSSAALILLGLVGLKRPEQVELERLAPPAFMRRLEEERRVRYEMDLLSRMQLGLLPKRVPELPGWQIAARSLLATEAGGDLYDFHRSRTEGGEDGHLWIAAGDVAGHGSSCSIAQAMTTAALSSVIAPGRTPSAVLQEVDRVLRRGESQRNFTSLALLRLDLTTGQALLANAGHPYPLLLVDGE